MKHDRNKTGQSLVEFALVIPLLILMITFFIDAGRAIFTYSELANAVREGTRYAIVHSTETAADLANIESEVRHYSPMLNPAEMDVNPIVDLAPDGVNKVINISATYLYRPITPGLRFFLGSSQAITLEAHSKALIAPLYQ